MNIDSSRLNADILVDKIGEDPEIFQEVWDIMMEDIPPVSMRASRVIWLFSEKHPCFLEPRIPEMVRALTAGIRTEGVRRNLANILSRLPVPEGQSGILFDFCYQVLESPREAIALKAYSMTILYNITNMETELKPELMHLLESLPEDSSAGIRARSNSILKKLRKEVGLR